MNIRTTTLNLQAISVQWFLAGASSRLCFFSGFFTGSFKVVSPAFIWNCQQTQRFFFFSSSLNRTDRNTHTHQKRVNYYSSVPRLSTNTSRTLCEHSVYVLQLYTPIWNVIETNELLTFITILLEPDRYRHIHIELSAASTLGSGNGLCVQYTHRPTKKFPK